MTDTVLRQILMLSRIPRYPDGITVRELRRYLRHEGMDVHVRTLQRDLSRLSARMPLLAEQNGTSMHWSWETRAPSLDVPAMRPAEALTLKMVQSHLETLLPGGVLEFLAPRYRQADRTLTALGRARPGHWHSRVAMLPAIQPLVTPDVHAEVAETVYEALFHGRCIRARYHPLETETSTRGECIIGPLGLVLRRGVAYLVGYVDAGAVLEHFALQRFEKAELTEIMVEAGDFDLDSYIEEGHFDPPAGRRINLKLDVSPELANQLAETPLEPDQRLRENGDGTAHVEARVAETRQLRVWLLSLGDQVRVLAPNSLRRHIRNTLSAAADGYRD